MKLRPIRWWIPEILNWLGAPAFIMRQARRDEVAETLRQARRDGLGLQMRCFQVGRRLRLRAPQRSATVAALSMRVRRLECEISALRSCLRDTEHQRDGWRQVAQANEERAELIRATIRRFKGRRIAS